MATVEFEMISNIAIVKCKTVVEKEGSYDGETAGGGNKTYRHHGGLVNNEDDFFNDLPDLPAS